MRFQLDNETRVAILANPLLLFTQEESPGSTAMIAGNSDKDGNHEGVSGRLLESLLSMLARAISSKETELAKDLIRVIESTDALDLGSRAWIHYYKSRIYVEDGNLAECRIELIRSIEAHPLSWSFYYLADTTKDLDPFNACEYFSKSMTTSPGLDAEATAHARNWLADFFDPVVYLKYNDDLKAIEKRDLFSHYKDFGYAEGRIAGSISLQRHLFALKKGLPVDFDWSQYIKSNDDLTTLLDKKSTSLLDAEYILTRHFVENGKQEGRSYRPTNYSATHASETLYKIQKNCIARDARNSLTKFLASSDVIEIGARQNSIITVIMVVHNKAEFTLQALLSIKQSSMKEVDLVVINNNSSDATSQLLDRVVGKVEIVNNTSNLHFLRSVNQSLQYVKTKYLCLLNNDAQLEYTALAATLECLGRYGGKAIVGGKVLHMDGYIQDAGSVVFSDGSCRGLGRRRDPGSHLFNFEREVDYISGAYLASSLHIIQALGGLDERFAPAYYEETDLCFRAAKIGIPVVYSPTIVIKHVEFGSSQHSEWAVQQMNKNRLRFSEIHKDRLQHSLSAGVFSEDSITCVMHGYLDERPKVLYIEDRIPSADLGSGFSRAADIVRSLQACSSHLSIFATDFLRSQLTVDHLPTGVECIEGNRIMMESLLLERHDFYDFIIVSREHNQELFGQVIATLEANGLRLKSKIVYDAESLFSIRNHLFAYLVNNGEHLADISQLNFDDIIKLELSRFDKADIVTTVSNLEKNLISRGCSGKQVINLGHPFPKYSTETKFEFSDRNSLLFLGAIHEEVSPNHDSLLWMRDEIFPELEKGIRGVGDFQILIAGNITCEASRDVITEMEEEFYFVKFLGLVKDPGVVFSRVRAFLAPTRYASGVPHKVHLAASHGVPTIATSLIGYQLGWTDQRAILTADTAFDFAACIIDAFIRTDNIAKVRQRMISAFNRDCDANLFDENVNLLLGGSDS
jgi:GT2 family glycosyltransferase